MSKWFATDALHRLSPLASIPTRYTSDQEYRWQSAQRIASCTCPSSTPLVSVSRLCRASTMGLRSWRRTSRALSSLPTSLAAMLQGPQPPRAPLTEVVYGMLAKSTPRSTPFQEMTSCEHHAVAAQTSSISIVVCHSLAAIAPPLA
jgi:hypothetical protein